jgi:regulator of nonsense transcripts 2
MRTQQQAEREEQQRIKNLVLNYDLTDDQQDGEAPSFHYIRTSSNNRVRLVGKGKLNESLPTRNNRGSQPQHPTASQAAQPPQQQTNPGGDKRRVSRDSGYSSPPPLLPASTSVSAQPTTFAAPAANRTIQHADNPQGSFESHPQIQPSRLDKSGNTRSKQRSRKLQLGDIDWYGRRSTPTSTSTPRASSAAQPATQLSLDSYVVDKSRSHGQRRGPRDDARRAAAGVGDGEGGGELLKRAA